MRTLRVALAQINTVVGDLDGNVAKILEYGERAREMNADVVAFPELTITGYPPEDLLLHHGLRSRVATAFAEVKDGVRGIAVYLGYPEYVGNVIYNSAALLKNGNVIANHRKVALPNYAVFDEKRWFQPGHGATVAELDGHAFGLLVCEDVWLPEPCRAPAAASSSRTCAPG